MKLLQLALQKQNYNLAAHIIVYGLIKAQVAPSRRCYGKKGNKKQGKK